MIITTIDELRLHSPAHALDTLDGLTGFIDNSEHDFLLEKLGEPLYQKLCQWYDDNQGVMSRVAQGAAGENDLPPFNHLCLMAQRVVAFDALGRAIGMQIVSVHNSGVNQMTAEDYDKPSKDSIDTYRTTCVTEAHAALNRLLRQLEQWAKKPDPAEGEGDDYDKERKEIVTLWKQSSYYYLAAGLLIPSCEVMMRYLNIYDSREKFIQLLPDLQFIQEEVIAPAIGEELLQKLVTYARDGKLPEDAPEGTETLYQQTVHKLRRILVALLVGRTAVLKYSKEQKIQAHDDGVRLLTNLTDFLKRKKLINENGEDNENENENENKDENGEDNENENDNGNKKEHRYCHCHERAEPACWTPPLF